MNAIIDRFEDDLAVIEYDGRTFAIPREFLPANAREGDVLRILVEIDTAATNNRRKKIKSLEDRLFKK